MPQLSGIEVGIIRMAIKVFMCKTGGHSIVVSRNYCVTFHRSIALSIHIVSDYLKITLRRLYTHRRIDSRVVANR